MTYLVSVLIPCYNAADYVEAAIESVLSQTWENIEIVLVSDVSTDGTNEVLEKYIKKYKKVKIISCSEPIRSAARSRNMAYRYSSGDYIKYFDADDLLNPAMIERQMARLCGSRVNIAFSEWGRFYDDDVGTFELDRKIDWRDMTGCDWLVESWMEAQPMMQSGMFLIPRQLLEKVGGWDEDLSLIDDFEFFARVLSSADRVLFSEGVPLMYRSGLHGSLSKRTTDEAIESAYKSLMRGTEHLLGVRSDINAQLACANILQSFLFSYYPINRKYSSEMERMIYRLGGSNINPEGSPNFHLVRRIVGWKVARVLENCFRRYS